MHTSGKSARFSLAVRVAANPGGDGRYPRRVGKCMFGAARFHRGMNRSGNSEISLKTKRLEVKSVVNVDFWLEVWLADRAAKPNRQRIFDGITDAAERCQRMRDFILAQGIADAPAGGVKRGTPKSFRECFERIYGEKL